MFSFSCMSIWRLKCMGYSLFFFSAHYFSYFSYEKKKWNLFWNKKNNSSYFFSSGKLNITWIRDSLKTFHLPIFKNFNKAKQFQNWNWYKKMKTKGIDTKLRDRIKKRFHWKYCQNIKNTILLDKKNWKKL